jgi:hypothetical protein
MMTMLIHRAPPSEKIPTLRIRYPFGSMNIGDSIRLDDFRKAESARVSAIQFAKRQGLNWKFSLRKDRHGWTLHRVL